MASKGQQYVEPSSDDETLVASTTTVSGGASLAKATVAAGVVAADAVTTTAASQQPQQQRRAGDDGDGDDGENAGDTKTTAAAENGNDDDLPEVSEQEVSEENLWRTLLDELPTKNPLRVRHPLLVVAGSTERPVALYTVQCTRSRVMQLLCWRSVSSRVRWRLCSARPLPSCRCARACWC